MIYLDNPATSMKKPSVVYDAMCRNTVLYSVNAGRGGHFASIKGAEGIAAAQEELAEQFGISLTGMKKCFKSIYGVTIGAWLTEYRMNQAAELLRRNQNRSVAEIAGLVGYDSASKFAMAFRKVMGMSPLEYRRDIR